MWAWHIIDVDSPSRNFDVVGRAASSNSNSNSSSTTAGGGTTGTARSTTVLFQFITGVGIPPSPQAVYPRAGVAVPMTIELGAVR